MFVDWYYCDSLDEKIAGKRNCRGKKRLSKWENERIQTLGCPGT